MYFVSYAIDSILYMSYLIIHIYIYTLLAFADYSLIYIDPCVEHDNLPWSPPFLGHKMSKCHDLPWLTTHLCQLNDIKPILNPYLNILNWTIFNPCGLMNNSTLFTQLIPRPRGILWRFVALNPRGCPTSPPGPLQRFWVNEFHATRPGESSGGVQGHWGFSMVSVVSNG